MDMSNGVWLLPTKGRIKNLKRFLNAAREMGTGSKGWILINRDEWNANREEYMECEKFLLKEWTFRPVDASCYGDAIRAVWDDVKDMDWIGLVSDDLVACTSNWDRLLVSRLQGWNVVSSNDGWQAPGRMHGAIAWSGDLARAVGWIFPEGFRHIFHDDVWETLGRESACWQVIMEVLCKHLHESLEGIVGPTMDRESELWKHDEAAYVDWLEHDKDVVLSRITDLQAKFNIKTMKPDFNGVLLLVVSPTIDGKYESDFVQSLFHTMRMMHQYGVVCEWAEERHTADVALARAKLFGVFLRSECTHLLMVDSDMGWGVDALIRLFAANKDLVCVAGPKKRYPLCFAANHTDKENNPLPLEWDQQTGTMEVSEVGMAFALLSKAAARKIADGYPELVYEGLTGEKEHAVFTPLVADNRYFSEDFAFCRRWRDLGGSVHIVPDVRLKHVGNHTFEGSFADAIQEQVKADAEMRSLMKKYE